MKNGYYYFSLASSEKSSDTNCVDKTLGYISITASTDLKGFSLQCSLTKERLFSLFHGHLPIELYLSPVTYITNTSVFIHRFTLNSKYRLFIDTRIPDYNSFSPEDNLYIIITAGGRTLMYSLIKEASYLNPAKEAPVDNCFGMPFDPFNTTNSAYKWFIHIAKTHGELEKIFRHVKIHPELFSKISGNGFSFSPDIFQKTAFYALRAAGHILRGEYTDPDSMRHFTIIGLPGWNVRSARRSAPSIRMYARWLLAQNKPEIASTASYNGYWLYYFESDSGFPVKAIVKRD